MTMSDFTIIPAIDLKDGHCVRLRQGKAEDETIYGEDPVRMARRWQSEGGTFLHVVDLSGAFEGRPVHDDVVIRIAAALSIPVEIGGGIRTDEQIERYLSNGINRVILGTRACASPEDLKRLVDRFGSGIAVGIDARDGNVQISGWVETTDVQAVDLAKKMDEIGVQTIIYTDTSRDGMMTGVNAEAMAAMSDAVACDVVASGGVTTAADVLRLKDLQRKNLVGVIVGKALYEGTVSLKALQA